MAQTTGGMSPFEMYVGLSTDGSSWTEVSGSALAVATGGGERAMGSAHTFDGNIPILTRGKKGFITVTVGGIYTEKTAQSFALAQAAYDNDTALYARWSPGGGDAGDFGYTTSVGYVINPPYPQGEAESADPIQFEIQLAVRSVTKATIGTAGW